MRKYKYLRWILIIVLVMFFTLGCENISTTNTTTSTTNTTTVQLETALDNSQTQSTIRTTEPTSNTTELPDIAAESTTDETKEVVYEPNNELNLNFDLVTWDFDENKIMIANENGFEAPFTPVEKSNYKPNQSDALQYDSSLIDKALYNSIKTRNIEGLVVEYAIEKLSWNDFFGDLEYTSYDSVKTVNLKGKSIYEAEIIDDYEKYFRYYDENEGVYYEVTDLMMGNFTDPEAVLTKYTSGNSCFYSGISGMYAPTYDPFVIEKGDQILRCISASLDGVPTIYIEKKLDESLYEEWISVKYGVVVKQLIFDQEGLLKKSIYATSIENKDIVDALFNKPNDIEFRDITLLVFSLTGGDTQTLARAVENTVSKDPHAITLQSNTGDEWIIYSEGLDEMSLKNPLYLIKGLSMSGEERTIIKFRRESDFYTICPELKMVEIFNTSCFEYRFFDFEKVNLYSANEVEGGKSYTFYDNKVDSVSGLIRFYEYVVDENRNKIVTIKVYGKESLTNDEIAGGTSVYKIIDSRAFNEQLYEIPSDYQIIDHGENSNNDGENMPFWYL